MGSGRSGGLFRSECTILSKASLLLGFSCFGSFSLLLLSIFSWVVVGRAGVNGGFCWVTSFRVFLGLCFWSFFLLAPLVLFGGFLFSLIGCASSSLLVVFFWFPLKHNAPPSGIVLWVVVGACIAGGEIVSWVYFSVEGSKIMNTVVPLLNPDSIKSIFNKFVASAASGSAGALNRAAFSLGGMVAGGLLLEERVSDALSRAAVGGGMTLPAARKVIVKGLEDGMAQPFIPMARDQNNNLAAFAGISCLDHELWVGRSGLTRRRVFLSVLREARSCGRYDEAAHAYEFTASFRHLATTANVALFTVRNAVKYFVEQGLLHKATAGTNITSWTLPVPDGTDDSEGDKAMTELLDRPTLLRNASRGGVGRTGVRGEEILHVLAAAPGAKMTVSEISERTGLRAATVRFNLGRMLLHDVDSVARLNRSTWGMAEVTHEDGSHAGYLTASEAIFALSERDGSQSAGIRQLLRFEGQRERFEVGRERFIERMVTGKREVAAAEGKRMPPEYVSRRIPRVVRRAYAAAAAGVQDFLTPTGVTTPQAVIMGWDGGFAWPLSHGA